MKVWVMFVEKPWKIWRNWEKSLGPSKVIIVPRSLDVVSINIIDLFRYWQLDKNTDKLKTRS